MVQADMKLLRSNQKAPLFALGAAALYAINIPLSKLLLQQVQETMLAALLYLGAGVGMLLTGLIRRGVAHQKPQAAPLTRKELPYTVAMVLLDILAPILLMLGISRTSPANVSLLNNFEIVATSLIALVVFREVISKQLWLAIGLVTLASILLSLEPGGTLRFDQGSLLVLGACLCWGFENNCTRKISHKSSQEIVVIKGCFSGLGSFLIALLLGERLPGLGFVAAALGLGFVSYGLSINCYILAQKDLGAAKTSAYYSLAPFLGVAFSLVLLGERPALRFYLALAIMALSAVLMARDSVKLQHSHPHQHTHTHPHRHGELVHTHPHTHTHSHLHAHLGDPEDHTHPHGDLPDHHHSHHPGQSL